MACALTEYCHFFNDNMKAMPIAAEYIRAKLCHGDYEHRNRFSMYQQLGGADIQCEPTPSDAEEVEKLIQSFREHRVPADR